MRLSTLRTRSLPLFSAAVLTALTWPAISASAQTTVAFATLPDSPGASLHLDVAETESSSAALADPAAGGAGGGQSLSLHSKIVASHTEKFIVPGQKAPTLSQTDKVRLGIKNAFSPFASLGWITAATYSQAVNSSPLYGQGWAPYGQRIGAAAARGSSEAIFSDSVLAPILHEDPRYYILGRGHSPIKRTLYAVTRTVITRTDSGAASPNFSLLGGNAAGAILTNVYYPQNDRSVKVTAATFGGAIGGSAIGFFLREFLSDALGSAHLGRDK